MKRRFTPEEKNEIRRVAQFRANLILTSVMGDWEPEDLIDKNGEEYVEAVRVEIYRIAGRLNRQSTQA